MVSWNGLHADIDTISSRRTVQSREKNTHTVLQPRSCLDTVRASDVPPDQNPEVVICGEVCVLWQSKAVPIGSAYWCSCVTYRSLSRLSLIFKNPNVANPDEFAQQIRMNPVNHMGSVWEGAAWFISVYACRWLLHCYRSLWSKLTVNTNVIHSFLASSAPHSAQLLPLATRNQALMDSWVFSEIFPHWFTAVSWSAASGLLILLTLMS